MTTLTPAHLQQQFEGSRLAAAAYAATDIKTLLNTNPSTHQLSAGLHNALLKQGFNIEQANNFVQKYTPVASLDQDGAGAVLFRVNGTDQVTTAVRGTDTKTFENIRNDIVLADATITQGQLPVYQTTLIANFVLRETTPAGQPVPQFAVQGGNSNAADLLRASSDSATTNQLMTAGGGLNTSMLSSPQITLPTIIQTGTTLGTGRAVGPCVDAAGHSEGSPEVTVVGAAIAQCTRITTVNGPGVSLTQMQHVANEITSKANLPAQDLASQNQINSQLNVGTAGMSVIDGLNGGLPGTNTTLGIPTSYGGLVGSHSSIVAMNAAEAAYRDAGGVLNPGSANLSDSYNFPDTAGAGRGVVNPDAGTPNTPDKPTVFNASTALPNYSGDNAVTVLPGDTVSSIAKRYDMTEQEFSSYLKDQYGPNADLNSIVAGSKLPLPPEVYERTLGGVNGLDLPADTAPDSTSATPTATPETPDFQDALLDAFTNADQAATDIKAQYPDTVQVADAGAALPDTPSSTNTLTHFINTQGTSLPPAQQDALATQIDKLGLGGEADLSFYSLPGGGALIANADGDIVGEINRSDAGGLNLRATGMDADGNSVEVSQHISESGQSLTDAQYSQQQLAQLSTQLSAGLGLVNNFQSLQNWGDLNDLSRLSTLLGTYNNLSNLTNGASGFLGDLGPMAGGLGLLAALDSGDGLGIVSSSLQLGQMGLNAYSGYMSELALQMMNDMMVQSTVDAATSAAFDAAAEAALESAATSSAIGQALPYISVITSLANFEDNPAQSIGSLVGMYFGGSTATLIMQNLQQADIAVIDFGKASNNPQMRQVA